MPELIGALPSQMIRDMMASGYLTGAREQALRPASLDLHISSEVYRMRGTFLPRAGESIQDILKNGVLYPVDIAQVPLELNGIYLIRLEESLQLPDAIYGHTNSRSTAGRVNLQTRLLVNGTAQFDSIPRGYSGPLWLEVIPKSFPIKLSPGQCLNQIRFFTGDSRLSTLEHEFIYDRYHLLFDKNGQAIPKHPFMFEGGGLTLAVDLTEDIIGYTCAPSTSRVLDFSADSALDPDEFFDPILRPKDGQLTLRRGNFYIMHSKEYIRVPSSLAVEMVPYDPSKGEFRAHYAGFFDPGWGWGEDGTAPGAVAVLEVFTHDNDFVLRDAQPICKMVYEKLVDTPERLYGGQSSQSHYHLQRGPRLSSHFRTGPAAPTYVELLQH